MKRTLILDCSKLAEARVTLGLSLSEAGRKLHLSKGTVWRVFSLGACGLTTARKVARLLGLDLAGLWLDARTLQPWRPGEKKDG